MFSNIVLIDMQ